MSCHVANNGHAKSQCSSCISAQRSEASPVCLDSADADDAEEEDD